MVSLSPITQLLDKWLLHDDFLSIHLESYVDFTGCPAFFDEVAAYPAVTIIRKGKGDTTRAAFRPSISKETLVPLAKALTSHKQHPQITVLTGICRNNQP